MAERKLGMVIDLALCTGCNACVVACKLENDVPFGAFNTWVESWDAERDGRTRRANLPQLCNHCENAPCVANCPTGASYKADDGTVQVDIENCIGCKACISACPYEARYFVESESVVGKCTFCHQRSSSGLLPACTSTCITSARIFGDLNDPDSDVAKRLAECESEASVLLPEKSTEPHVYYIGYENMISQTRVSGIQKGGNTTTPYEGRQQ